MTARHFLIIIFFLPTIILGQTINNSSATDSAMAKIIGKWQQYPNTTINDTLFFRKLDTNYEWKLNPNIIWSFETNGEATIEESSSNFSTTNGVLDGKDKKDSSWTEIMNKDTIHYASTSTHISGVSLQKENWTFSNNKIITLSIIDTEDKKKTDTYTLITLTNRQLILLKIK
jgi:hypothetical protein